VAHPDVGARLLPWGEKRGKAMKVRSYSFLTVGCRPEEGKKRGYTEKGLASSASIV